MWKKARAAAFEDDSPLRGVRRHDLRHSAITLWLNRGVPLKTAQRWSAHKTLSVLLDTYLGVMRTDEDVAVERVEAALAVGAGSGGASSEHDEAAEKGTGEPAAAAGGQDRSRWQAHDNAHGQRRPRVDGNGDD